MVRHTPPRLTDIMLRPLSQTEFNQRYSLIEVMGIGFAAGVGTFLSVFMVRLGRVDIPGELVDCTASTLHDASLNPIR